MMKIILVDDERIALEHVKSLLLWDGYGYEIAASASNGRTALRLCEELRPQIMIVDIRMPVMDGLELIRAVSERKLGVKFIVMSAYEDFEYARQAIAIGSVSSYLIKHEVDRDKLLHELNKAKESWESEEKQRKIERSEQLMKIVMGAAAMTVIQDNQAAPPYAILLIQRDSPFSAIPSPLGRTVSLQALDLASNEISLYSGQSDWQLIGEFPLNRNQFIALFSQKNKSISMQRKSFEDFARSAASQLKQHDDGSHSFYYAFQSNDSSSLHDSFRKVEAAARHAVFSGKNTLLCADELPMLPIDNEIQPPVLPRNTFFEELIIGMNQHDPAKIESAIKAGFNSLCDPLWDLAGLYETIHTLTGLINKRYAAKGLPEADPFTLGEAKPLYHIEEIMNRFIVIIQGLCSNKDELDRLSNKLLRAIQYIQLHYHEDINIEDVARSIGISPSYLHQLFKRELGRTFLDYLTEYRINQAKRILNQEDAKMTEVSARVGYRSPQHFSQVFKKMTGMLPHQYRNGGHQI
jgi:two-component system response regulator YesN